MRKELLTDQQVEMEIERLTHSEEVRLARAEQRIKYKRRQYMYQLKSLAKRGEQLAADGYSLENIESLMLGDACENVEAH